MKLTAAILIAVVSTAIVFQLGLPQWALDHLSYSGRPAYSEPYSTTTPAPRVPRQQPAPASTTVGDMVANSSCCHCRAGEPLVLAPEGDDPVSIPATTPALDLGNGKLRIEYTGPDGRCTIYVIDKLP